VGGFYSIYPACSERSNNNSYCVRIASPPLERLDSDGSVLLKWRLRFYLPWNDPHKDIRRKLQVDRELFLVGLIESNIVATVMGGYEGHRGWINYLAVDPNHRHRGYGTEILGNVERLISALGCPKINLQIRTSNSEAIAFYESLGYRTDDVVGLGKRLTTDES